MKTALVKFMYSGKMYDVRVNCVDTKGLDDALVRAKMVSQIHKKIPGATIIMFSWEN